MKSSFTNSDILKILKTARLFAQFTDDQLKQLISFSSVESFESGQTILEQEAPNEKFYVLLQGHVAIYTDDEFIIRLRRQGDLVGEISVITKRPTTARVVAEGFVSLFSISSDNIDQSDQAELKSTVYKLFLDILTEKLTMTTKQVIGFQATTEELTEKKQELAKSEDVIQQKEAILQQVLGSMSDGVVVMEKQGQLLHVNAAFREMTGDLEIPGNLHQWPEQLGFYRTDETSLYHPKQLPMETIFTDKPVDSEEILVRNKNLPDGVWLQASSRMLTSDTGSTPKGAVVVFRDFTKKKLEEKALITAKESAEAAAKAKSNFLAIMSHELRTPLNGIMGMTDLIYGTDLSDEQEGLLDTLKASSENLLNLIRNILDYNNLESEKHPMKLEPFSMAECFKEIIDAYKPQARKKNLHLATDLSSRLPEKMLGNTRGILQILRNLMDNAIKFTDKGEIKLSVELIFEEGERTNIRISVQDTGIGIDNSRLDYLFEPFSQADSSFSRSFDGAGIGLSLCRKYVDKMGGTIKVTSTVDKGSRFDVFLTLEAVAEKQDTTTPKAAPENQTQPDESFAIRYPLKILVAEDNALNQKLIKKVLHKLGYSPEIVNNGLEAVEYNRTNTYDLILMDLQMPKMDGLEASRVISQENTTTGKPKIIALTANVSEEVRESCLEAGMVDYTTKPLKINQLIKLLQKLQ